MDTKQLGTPFRYRKFFYPLMQIRILLRLLCRTVPSILIFEITSCDEESYTASIQTEITTFDSNAILNAYQAEQETYLNSC